MNRSRFALVVSSILLLFLLGVSYSAAGKAFTDGFLLRALLSVGAAYLAYNRLTARDRKREKLLHEPFPAEWDAILSENVSFYNSLNEEDKKRFQYETRKFIMEKRITGIKTSIDDSDRLLVASSAIIPIFGFGEWEYDNLNEVLLYPNSFSTEFQTEGGKDRSVLGMVGTGYMNGMMILSQPDLHRSFSNDADKHNVAIHEFVHLIDKSDGNVDGIPEALLDRQYTLPWLNLIQEEIQSIQKGKSDINPYGAFNKQEFFAVASEYFFEQPAKLQEKHPELYKLLQKIFRQDMKSRFSRMVKRIFRKKSNGTISRNSPCPCGSGKKYKKCCGEGASGGGRVASGLARE